MHLPTTSLVTLSLALHPPVGINPPTYYLLTLRWCTESTPVCPLQHQDIGAPEIQLYALNKLPYGRLDSKLIGLDEGVIFVTYSSLIASQDSGKTRFNQILNW